MRLPNHVLGVIFPLLCLLATGCSSVAPRAVRITLDGNLNRSPVRDQINVQVFTVSDEYYQKHLKNYNLNEYWQFDDALASHLQNTSKDLSSGSSTEPGVKSFQWGKSQDDDPPNRLPVTLGISVQDKDFWKKQEELEPGYVYLVVVANGPYDKVLPTTAFRRLSSDPWCKILPLQSSYWDDDDAIDIQVTNAGLRLSSKQPKDWQTP